MGGRNQHVRSGWCALPAGILLFGFAGAMAVRGEAPDSAANGKTTAPEASRKAADLTGLSLEELYDLDVVQLNVLGGHTHPAGQIMFGFQFMYSELGTIKQGSEEITPAQVFAQGFTVAHTKMTMSMYMFDAMYAPSDSLTLMAMMPYKQMDMQHFTVLNQHYTQHASGIGDFQLMGLYTFLGDIRKGGNRLVLNLGAGFPTGSMDVQDHALGDPTMPLKKLEYPMQLGSGTYDLLPGLTYLGDAGRWAWGAQTLETVRLGRNSSGYRFGNRYNLMAWGAYGVTDWFAPYLRLDGQLWENITGADPAYGPVPTSAEATASRQAGGRIDLLFGLNVFAPQGVLKGNRLVVEGGFPIYEHLTGPQLGLNWLLNVGWTYAF